MNEVGVLGAFIPEFGRIVAMMQFNMYHYYTVDEHIIRTVSTLSQIERRELTDDLPIATDIMTKGVNRRVLYVALLLHDIGKGSGRDHSALRRRGRPPGSARGSASTPKRPSWWSGWCAITC